MMQVTVDLNSIIDGSIYDQFKKLSTEQNYLLDINAKYCILSFIATLWTINIFIILYVLISLTVQQEMVMRKNTGLCYT